MCSGSAGAFAVRWYGVTWQGCASSNEITDQIACCPELAGSHYLTGAKEFRFSNGAVLYLHYL